LLLAQLVAGAGLQHFPDIGRSPETRVQVLEVSGVSVEEHESLHVSSDKHLGGLHALVEVLQPFVQVLVICQVLSDANGQPPALLQLRTCLKLSAASEHESPASSSGSQ
jgi:hypothetical protein